MGSVTDKGGCLQAAAAVANITPAIGCVQAGYGSRERRSDKVADELYSKVLVFEWAGLKAAIIACDLIGIPRDLVGRIRAAVRNAAGIDERNILVCASHTHFGPIVEDENNYLPENLDGPADHPWIEELVRKISAAAAVACRSLRSVRVGCGIADAGHLCFNRRTIRPDGKVEMSWLLPPQDAPLTFGPKDSGAGIVKIETTAGAPVATLVNFGCHAVCGGENFYAISADYPGYTMKSIEREHGGVCLFTAGGAGNIVPLERGGTSRKKIGEGLGAMVLGRLPSIAPCAVRTLKTSTSAVRIPLKQLLTIEQARHDVDEARKLWSENPNDTTAANYSRAKNAMGLSRRFGLAGEYEAEVQAIRIGDVTLVGLPGEIFCEITLALKKSFPAGRVIPISLSNDYPGYIPDGLAYEQGGYEPEWTVFARGADDALVRGAKKTIEEVLQ
jgi:hypothetical protein